MNTLLKALIVIFCLCGSIHQLKAQSPSRRLQPAAPAVRTNIPRPPVQKDYKWHMAEIQRKYPQLAKRISTPSMMPKRGLIARSRFQGDRLAAVDAGTQAHHQRLMQRYPQLQQKKQGFAALSMHAPMNYRQVAEVQHQRVLKRLEEYKRRDLK